MEKKIDFVIIWVDGSDHQWQHEKNKYLAQETGKKVDASEERYRDWDILKYWFRAVEQYAPWVNRVHFVTCGHVPEWLNLNAPKLNFIKHSDYIPKQYLPTFSSHPIELNLHHISELSEQFVYFNDDFFLNAPVKPEDFFFNGLPCDCIEERPIEFCQRDLYNHIQVNEVVFMNRHFNRLQSRREHPGLWYSFKTPHISVRNLILGAFRCRNFFGLHPHHLPQAYLKSTLNEVWEAEQDWLNETCGHRFRNQEDLSQFVFKFWQLLHGRFHPYNKRRFGKVFQLATELDEIEDIMLNQKYKAICLNDSGVIVDFEERKQRLCELFEKKLPEKSSFEL